MLFVHSITSGSTENCRSRGLFELRCRNRRARLDGSMISDIGGSGRRQGSRFERVRSLSPVVRLTTEGRACKVVAFPRLSGTV